MAKWTKFFVDITRMIKDEGSAIVVEEMFIEHFRAYSNDRCKFKSVRGWNERGIWGGDYSYFLMLKFKSLTDATMFKLVFGEYIVSDISRDEKITYTMNYVTEVIETPDGS